MESLHHHLQFLDASVDPGSALAGTYQPTLVTLSVIVATLAAVDYFATQIAGAKSATVCVARLDTASAEFEYCTAGHPPLVITADGPAQYLRPTGAARLTALAVRDVALLYSDGIIERPGRDLPASTVEVGAG